VLEVGDKLWEGNVLRRGFDARIVRSEPYGENANFRDMALFSFRGKSLAPNIIVIRVEHRDKRAKVPAQILGLPRLYCIQKALD
jgi:hypothetical protein